MGVFHVFLNCTNGTKSRKAPYMNQKEMDLNIFKPLSMHHDRGLYYTKSILT